MLLTRSLALLTITSFVALVGCGSNEAKDSVSGTVTLNGKAVTGTIAFVQGDKEANGPISPKGDYSVVNPPKGDCDIVIKGFGFTPPSSGPKDAATPKDAGGGAGTSDLGTAPPAKYSKPGNGLKLTVTGGKQKHDIALTP